MVPAPEYSQGISGTIDAFNFIRRIGFPSTPEVVSAFVTLTGLAVLLSLPYSGLSLGSSLLIAVLVILLPTLVGEFLNSTIFLRGDPVLNFRRLMGMELVCWWTLLILLPISSLTGGLVGNRILWVDGFFVALVVSLPVRFLTMFAMSGLSFWRKLIASVLVPAASFRVYVVVTSYLSLPPTLPSSIPLSLPPAGWPILPGLVTLLSGVLLSGVGVFLIIRRVDNAGSPEIGDSPMGLFRDFLRHWLKAEPEPLENRLATLGSNGRIAVSTLAFEGGRSRSAIIVSNFHPGPYRDLGSGGLPAILKASMESTLGSTVLVPHGISNHEYNIISHKDIRRLVHETGNNYPLARNTSGASRFVRETSEEAKASAQIFGDTVLLTLTLAPRDMEDIPSPVLEAIEALANAKGLHAIIADAHNSLTNQTSITPQQAAMLKEAAVKALRAVSGMPRSSFKVGSASDPLKEFGIEDGIGPGGLAVLTVECQGQCVAYITIDGNNMETGFREMILESMKAEGVDDGEVMTTDTHLVAGVVRSRLGYHPVGENMNKKLLIAKIREGLRTARTRMEDGSTGFSLFHLDLRVLGSSSFQRITSFVGHVAKNIGRSFLRLELAVFALSVVILAVL